MGSNEQGIFIAYSMPHHQILSCHVDSLFMTWQNVPYWGAKYFTMWTKVQCEETHNFLVELYSFIPTITSKILWPKHIL